MKLCGAFIGRSKLNHTGDCAMNYVCIKGREHPIKGGHISYFLLLNRTKTPSQTLKKGVFRGIAAADRVKPYLRLGEKCRHHRTQLLREAQTDTVRTLFHKTTDS